MPLLYGEGTKAFQRLQTEIIKTSDDESIFAWRRPEGRLTTCVFALRVHLFGNISGIERTFAFRRQHWEMTNKGLRLSLSLQEEKLRNFFNDSHSSSHKLAKVLIPLNCSIGKPRYVFEVRSGFLALLAEVHSPSNALKYASRHKLLEWSPRYLMGTVVQMLSIRFATLDEYGNPPGNPSLICEGEYGSTWEETGPWDLVADLDEPGVVNFTTYLSEGL